MYLADVHVGVVSFLCYKLAERKSPQMDGINAIITCTKLKKRSIYHILDKEGKRLNCNFFSVCIVNNF